MNANNPGVVCVNSPALTQVLFKIASVRGAQLLEVVDDLPPFLTKGITKKIKESKENEVQYCVRIDLCRSLHFCSVRSCITCLATESLSESPLLTLYVLTCAN